LDATPVLESFGTLQSRRLLELRAAVAGRVVELSPDFVEGGHVEAGQLLVRLDPADAEAEVARAQSDVADARAEGRDAARGLALARDEVTAAQDQAALQERALARQRDLADRGVGTAISSEAAELAASAARQAVLARRQSLAQAEARVDQAATLLSRSQIALAEAERRLADTTLRAPFSGTLNAAELVEGRLVSVNERVAELLDPDDLEVSFRISTAQYARLLDDQGALIPAEVAVMLDAAGVDLTATGRITRTGAGAGDGASGRVVFATLENAVGFRPSDFVTVRVQEPVLRSVTALPATAVDAQGEVLVLGTGDRLEVAQVEVLRRQADTVLVRGDIEGREVVQARTPLLGAGIAVSPLRRGGETAQATPAEPEMVKLTEERRARLVAFVEGNTRMPQDAKARVLAQLAEPAVSAQVVARIESRMGG
jgi:multidrug efflux pump subunit AcrA (membrane-fusion protein)